MAEAQESTLRQDLNHPESRKRALYAAFASKDARFDGQAFVGVSSTGVYCRPVCHVHMPKYENCTFYETAAEAEAAGYRPCLVCRPELAPGHSIADASANLARRAASLLREGCTSGESLERMAERLGYTDRHLRRAFQREFEVTPVQYLQTCRLLLAKSLLTDSDLPVSQVAAAAGFKSVRRFNDLFKERYRLTPTAVRKSARRRTPSGDRVAFARATVRRTASPNCSRSSAPASWKAWKRWTSTPTRASCACSTATRRCSAGCAWPTTSGEARLPSR